MWWALTKQFFDDEMSKICNDLANQRIECCGLDMDFKEIPLDLPALMATAEYVTKVHAVLAFDLANYSFRKTDNDKLVMLGETEEYEPLSRAAYYHAMRKIRIKK
jgi:thymidine kinase